MEDVSFHSQACQDFALAARKEWRLENKAGACASASILGLNTRRSHGMLVAKLKSPLGYHIILNNVDEILHVDDLAYALSTRVQSGRVFPDGFHHMNQFSMNPNPTWIFHVEDLILEKSLILLPEEQTVMLRYRILEGDDNLVRLELRPIMAFRSIQELHRENANISTTIEMMTGRIKYAGTYFSHNAAIVDRTGTWFRSIEYPEDHRRRLDYEEDLYAPFRLMYAFCAYRENYLCVSLTEHDQIDFENVFRQVQDDI